MKVPYRSGVAGLALTLAISVFAARFAVADQADPQIQKDMDNGVTDLGIDITQAGSTPQSIQRFLASLNPEARRAVEGACARIRANQASAAPPVVAFCITARM